MTQQSLMPLPALDLRDYQQEALDKLLEYRRNGGSRALVALPTGTGKTVIFAQIPRFAKKKVLVIAHRQELLDQSAEKIQWANPSLKVDIEQAERRAAPDAQVIVASIQTLAVSKKRLAALDPDAFSSIIIDEAHHTLAESYLYLLHHFGLAPDPGAAPRLVEDKHNDAVAHHFESFTPALSTPFLVGLTATPSRSDGQGLEYIYDDIVFSRTIREMMDAGWLCKIRGIKIKTPVDISKVKTQAGDFQEKSLAETIDTPERNAMLVGAYLEHAKDRRALVFCVNVQHAEHVSATFDTKGIKAPVVVGTTPSEQRKATIKAFKTGDVRVMVGVMVFTEGFDAPETDCVLMARPTKSSLIYTQAVGRGTRIAPGKQDLLVIDMVDISRKVGIQTINTLFGLPPKLQLGGSQTVAEAQDEYAKYRETMPEELFKGAESIEELEKIAYAFDPLAQTMVGAEILSYVDLAWVRTASGYVLSLLGQGQVGVVEDLLGRAVIRYKMEGQVTQIVGTSINAKEAMRKAELWLLQHAELASLYERLSRNAKWRQYPASEKQIALLNRLKDEDGDPVRFLPNIITRGQASALIDRYFKHHRPAYIPHHRRPLPPS